jgi:hypothetical protein
MTTYTLREFAHFLAPQTDAFTLDESETGAWVSNLNGIGAVFTVQLPIIAPSNIGMTYLVGRAKNQTVRVYPAGGERIRGGGPGQYAELQTNGTLIGVWAASLSDWELWAAHGTYIFGGP